MPSHYGGWGVAILEGFASIPGSNTRLIETRNKLKTYCGENFKNKGDETFLQRYEKKKAKFRTGPKDTERS